MIVVVARSKIYETVEELNSKNLFSLQRLVPQSITGIIKTIETDDQITHALIDLHGIRSNIDDALNLIERLGKTCPQLTVIVIASDYDDESNIVKDIADIGVKYIVTDELIGLKRRLNEIFLEEGIFEGTTSCRTPSPSASNDDFQTAQVSPPSAVSRAEGKALYQSIKPPLETPTSNIVIAVAGSGERVGTTTQAMQILHYLNAQEQSVALVQMFGENKLADYLEILPDSKSINEEHYQINGLDFFKSGKSIGQAKALFDFIICDYGNYLQLPDITSFLDKDIRIIVGGIKPWEIKLLHEIFAVDADNEINYILTSVPSYDKKLVVEGMGDSGNKTFFAPYTPDYWHYCGEDDLYKKLTDFSSPKKKSSKKQKISKWPFGIFAGKGE